MSEKQQWILAFLDGKGWTSPTDIGLARSYGQRRSLGSAWASPECQALVASGHLERNDAGHYRPRDQRR